MAMKPARRLDIVLRSATGLKKVSSSRMAAYAVAWMNPSLRVPSPMDKRHGRNPKWNATISLTLDDRTLNNQVEGQQRLHIELLGRGLVSTTPIGFVTIDISDILLQGSHGDAVRAPFHDYPVRRKSGRQQGILNFELCLQASASTTQTTLDNVMDEYDDAVSTSWSSSSASPPQQYQQRSMNTATPQQYEQSSMPTATPQHQYYQSRSMKTGSAPPVPQYYQRETVGTVASPRQQREMERSIKPEASSYGFALPMATTNPVSQQDEISLLHSYY